MKFERSFWENELYASAWDLIIAGGGLTGQSIALFYKRAHPKARVMVIDRGFFPLGASTRNAGFACFGSVTEHMADMELEEEKNIITRIGRRVNGLKLLRETLGDEQIDYAEPGAWEIFTDEEKYEEAVLKLDLFNSWLNEAAGLKNVYAQGEFNGFPAISIKHEGCLHPGKMMKTLYHKNLELGVEFRWNTRINSLETEWSNVVLENGITLQAHKLAVAANSFTPDLLTDIGIVPGRGFVFITKPIPDLAWKGTFHYDRGYYYFRSVGNDRLLLGGARSLNIEVETTTEFGVNPIIKNHLVDFAHNVLKLPSGWEIEQEWSGIMGFTSTKSPVLQKKGANCVVAAGLSGMGVALGMQLGREAAAMLQSD